VYSLGVTLAELAGRRAVPIFPIGAGISQDVVPSLDVTNRNFNSIVRKMTAMSPGNRHASMAEVAFALRNVSRP
jgi:hypothetical protein